MLTSIPFILSVMMAVAIVSCLTPAWIHYLQENGRIAEPNHRSSHKTPTPSMGGIVFVPVVLMVGFFMDDNAGVVSCFLIAAAALLGFQDDRKDLSAKVKFFFQGLIAMVIYSLGFTIEPIAGEFGIQLPEWLNFMGTVVFILGVVNAFNLIDGIDGLAMGVCLISGILFSVIFYLQGNEGFFYLSAAVTIGLVAFLQFNLQPARIFLGDTGSLLLGTYIVICLLNIASAPEPIYRSIVVSVIIYPCMDMLRLFLGRFLVAQSPFKADRNHFHHLLIGLGLQHWSASLFLYVLHTALIVTTILLSSNQPFVIQFFVLLLLNLCFYGLLQLLRFLRLRGRVRRRKKVLQRKLNENVLLKNYVL